MGQPRHAYGQVGEEFRKSNHVLEAGDVVAIIPPVSGG